MNIKSKRGVDERVFQNWRRRFGKADSRATRTMNALTRVFVERNERALEAFRAWKIAWRATSAEPQNAAPSPEFHAWKIDAKNLTFDESAFLLQTYVAQTILAIVERDLDFAPNELDALFGPSPFDWASFARPLLDVELDTLRRLELDRIAPIVDPFANIYTRFFSGRAREQLGEFYTPAPLAKYLYSLALDASSEKARVLDPTCGAGVFLTSALRQALRETSALSERAEIASETLLRIAGADLSPLAVLTARANLLYASTSNYVEVESRVRRREIWNAISKRLNALDRAPLPVYLWDSVLDKPPLPDAFDLNSGKSRFYKEQFDALVGNPPWILWDKLSKEYRDKTKETWRAYGLFDLSGKEARYGGGKKELASLLLYSVVDKRLTQGGVFAFVLPRSLFQKGAAGASFRRFGEQIDKPFAIRSIDDLTDVEIFPRVTSRAACALGQKGHKTNYPIELRRWSKARALRAWTTNSQSERLETIVDELRDALNDGTFESKVGDVSDRFEVYAGKAVPTSSAPGSPLAFESVPLAPSDAQFSSEESRVAARIDQLAQTLLERAQETRQTCAYVAQLGANAAGAASVFWGAIEGDLTEERVIFFNWRDAGKKKAEPTRATLESALVFPLLRWVDVDAYFARTPQTYIVLPQDPQKRRGYSLDVMREKYPLTLAYFERFESMLRERAAYRRYQTRAPFWSAYNVDVNTFAQYKVVWRRMDSHMRAAVVAVDPRFGKPIAPQDTLSMTRVESLDEGRYLCAALNSRPARERFDSAAVANSKSFGSPGMIRNAPIPKYDPNDPIALELVQLCKMMEKWAKERDKARSEEPIRRGRGRPSGGRRAERF